MADCFICKGRNPRRYCGREFCPIYQKFGLGGVKKVELDFSGSSPPEIFVGRYGYPNVFAGILSPVGHLQDSGKLSCAEEWFARGMDIEDILGCRGSLIYSRFVSDVKGGVSNVCGGGKLLSVMKEVSMAQKPCDMDFKLSKKPSVKVELDKKTAPIGNIAPLRKAIITSNPKIPHKVDYVVSDDGLKAANGVINLYSKDVRISSLSKLLSAGLLGLKRDRKLVPSRWAVTAVDNLVSGMLVENVKRYNWLNECMVFHGDYVGNHYEFILIPRVFSFEVIEAKMGGSVWNPSSSGAYFMMDYETAYKRKEYAGEVTGAYYANRLAVCEYLNKIRRQASVLVLREARPEYYAPLGVGVLREVSRSCFRGKGERFCGLGEALKCAGSRLRIPVEEFVGRSRLIKDIKEQVSLKKWV
ncbi:MAG: hypothetical protein KKG60_01140 [Nanoarchaeota archaeon]|nr:hypothetical protein [Nanoarchaeota archaeon]